MKLATRTDVEDAAVRRNQGVTPSAYGRCMVEAAAHGWDIGSDLEAIGITCVVAPLPAGVDSVWCSDTDTGARAVLVNEALCARERIVALRRELLHSDRMERLGLI